MSDEVMTPVEENTSQQNDYFEKVPLWGADGGKCFEIMADAVSGRIPVTRLESWREFTDLLESDFFNRPSVQLVFRGHRRFDWSLMPTLGRLTTNGIVTEALAQAQLERELNNPSYRKRRHGPIAAQKIGLTKIEAECAFFAAWLAQIRELA